MAKKTPSRAAKPKGIARRDASTYDRDTVDRYVQVFDEIRRFTDLLVTDEEHVAAAEAEAIAAKVAHDRAKEKLAEARNLREGTRLGLIKFLSPTDGEILPLFDRMEPADEDRHGVNSSDWRAEPIAALRLSLPSQTALIAAEVMLVGQLQDRILAKPETWWEAVDGMSYFMACAVADMLAAFINERSGE